MNTIEGLSINHFKIDAVQPPKEYVPKKFPARAVLDRYARLLDVGVGQVFRDERMGMESQQQIALNQYEQGILEDIRKQDLQMNAQVAQLEHALGNGLSSIGDQIKDGFATADIISENES